VARSAGAAPGAAVRVAPDPPDGWDALVDADPGASPAQRSGIAEAFAAVLPGHSVEYRTVAGDGGLAGGHVLCVSRVAGAEWLHAMPYLLPGAPLARAGAHAAVDDAIGAALAVRAAQPWVAGGAWSCLRAGTPIADTAIARVAGETRRFAAAVVELGAGAARRWDTDRRERKALRRAGRAGLRCEEDPAALEACYVLHQAQSRRWPGHRPLPLALLRRLLAPPRAGAPPLARLFVAHGARRLLAGILVLDGAHEMLAWWSGTHPDALEVAAPRALLVWAIERAAADGRRRFNLGASGGLSGVASFKRSFGAADVDYPVRWLAPCGGGRAAPPLRALLALQRRARAGRYRGDVT